MKKTKSSGFTLIEILIVTALMAILGLALLGLQFMFTQGSVSSFRNYLNVEEANKVVSVLSREIRNIRPSDNGAYPLERALDQEITFYSDIDYDGNSEKVRYTLNGTNLEKGIINPTGFPVNYPASQETVTTVAENISNDTDPIFFYYNGNWPDDTTNNPLPQPIRLSETKLMKVSIKISTSQDEDKNYILETYTQLRMLKENL